MYACQFVCVYSKRLFTKLINLDDQVLFLIQSFWLVATDVQFLFGF